MQSYISFSVSVQDVLFACIGACSWLLVVLVHSKRQRFVLTHTSSLFMMRPLWALLRKPVETSALIAGQKLVNLIGPTKRTVGRNHCCTDKKLPNKRMYSFMLYFSTNSLVVNKWMLFVQRHAYQGKWRVVLAHSECAFLNDGFATETMTAAITATKLRNDVVS